MNLKFGLITIVGLFSFFSPIMAQESDAIDSIDTPGNDTIVPKEGVDYASFELPGKPNDGAKSRTIIPILYILHQVFHPKRPPVCQYGTDNCCYGKDSNGCCIGGSGNCNICPGPRCPYPCFNGIGPGCPAPICPGPFCPYQCPGPNCPYVCPGPYCPSLCPGPRCPIVCPGPNCPVECPGPFCPTPCSGPFCGIITCPPQICNISYPNRPIIFNVNINQNIFIVGNRPGYVCIRVPTPDGGFYRLCGPPDVLKCYRTPSNVFQVRINNVNDPRLSGSQE